MQAWCTTASISSVVIPGRMWDAAMSRTSRASCEMMNDIRPRPSKSHIRRRPACKNEACTYPTNGSHLLLLLRTQYAGRLAGTPRFGSRHSLKKKTFDVSTSGRHLEKAWPENHLRRNQAGVCDQARLLWAKEDIQGAEGQRNQSWEMD